MWCLELALEYLHRTDCAADVGGPAFYRWDVVHEQGMVRVACTDGDRRDAVSNLNRDQHRVLAAVRGSGVAAVQGCECRARYSGVSEYSPRSIFRSIRSLKSDEDAL